MDISFNRHITYEELNEFLVNNVSYSYSIVYEEEGYDWDNVKGKQLILEYIHEDTYKEWTCTNNSDNINIVENHKFGLSVFPIKPEVEYMSIVENLSLKISTYFSCSTSCDASRIVLNTPNYYYSLLYEQGKVYLVDDTDVEEYGCLRKIIEISYALPHHEIIKDKYLHKINYKNLKMKPL